MAKYPKTMDDLIRYFSRFPGVGPRSAERMAFHLLKSPKEESKLLAQAIEKLRETTRYCERCFNLSEEPLCDICSDSSRESKVICVVEVPKDIIAIERSGNFKVVYHVLLGTISPLEGIGPKDIKVKELMERLQDEAIREVILACGSHSEGETTALYIAKLLKPFSLSVTRIAYGVPVGANLEFTDQASLSRAFTGRQSV